jgi:hypothetical protein
MFLFSCEKQDECRVCITTVTTDPYINTDDKKPFTQLVCGTDIKKVDGKTVVVLRVIGTQEYYYTYKTVCK